MHLPARHTRTPTVWVFDAVDDRLIGRVVAPRSDLRAVDALARICLAAKRRGLRPTLRGTPPELYSLLALTGLTSITGSSPTSCAGRPNSPNHSGPPM